MQKVNLKLNKDKCHFRCTSVQFFGEIISRHGVMPDPQKLKALMEMTPPKTKNKLQAFLGIINYWRKFSPSTAGICESLRQLTLNKTEWAWNAKIFYPVIEKIFYTLKQIGWETYIKKKKYQKLFNKAKSIISKDACMKFYNETQPLHLETPASGVGLRAVLLQTRSGTGCPRDKAPDNSILRPLAFASKKPVKCRKKV